MRTVGLINHLFTRHFHPTIWSISKVQANNLIWHEKKTNKPLLLRLSFYSPRYHLQTWNSTEILARLNQTQNHNHNMYFVLNLSSKDTTVPWYTCLSEPGQYHNNYFIYLCLNEAAVFAEKRRSQEGTGQREKRGDSVPLKVVLCERWECLGWDLRFFKRVSEHSI